MKIEAKVKADGAIHNSRAIKSKLIVIGLEEEYSLELSSRIDL